MSVFTSIEADRLEVYPGGGASSVLHVRNNGAIVNEYRVEVLGPSSIWAEVEPAVLPLFPGNEGTFTITWRPPRNADSQAGTMPFGLRVVPAEHPEDSRVEEGRLTLGPFYAMELSLVPVTSRGRFGAGHRVIVENQSNAEAAIALTALDPDALLRFRFRPSAFRLAPGASRSIKMRVHPRRHKIRGHDERRAFQVYGSQQGQEPQRVDGALNQRAVIAGWQFKVVVLAAVLLIAALVLAKFRQGEAHTLADSSTPLPPVPVHLVATSTTSLEMTWSNAGVNVFSGYEIQSNGQTVATPPGDNTAYAFNNLKPGTTHCYIIRSIESKNTTNPDSAFSPQVCATTLSPPVVAAAPVTTKPATVTAAPPPAPGAPPAPVPVTAQVLDANDIKLTWTPKGGTGFVIQDSGQQVATPNATDSAHTFSGLADNSTHCYVIWAVGPGGTSPHVTLPCTTTIGPATAAPPQPPASVTATPVGTGSIQVSWTDPNASAATGGYQIFENGSQAATQPAGATAYTFTNLTPGSMHCYAVRSVSATTQSGFAPNACATVNTPLPPNVNLTAAGVFSITAASISPSEGDGRAVIGGTVTYAVTINIPTTGSKQAVLNLDIPTTTGGLAVESNPSTGKLNLSLASVSPSLRTDVSGGFAAAVSQATTGVGSAGAPSGQTLTINLGDITNSSTDTTAAQTITIDVPTVVLNNNTGANSASAAGINTNGSSLTVSASLTSLLNGSSTTSTVQTATIGVANPSPTLTWTPATGSSEQGTLTVTLGSASTAGEDIYQPQIELPSPSCVTATETGNSAGGIGCNSSSQTVTFDQPLASGASVITLTLLPGVTTCPTGAVVEWLSSTGTGQSLSGNPTYVSYAWPRSGPNDDQRPVSEQIAGTEGDDVPVTGTGC